jgi:hypothetical protein
MKDTARSAVVRLLVAAAFLAAAHTQAYAQGQGRIPIAMLLVAGPYVTVNGRPAASGMTISSGDTLVTGPASSARLAFYSGGSLQLDANTDPQIFAALAGYVGYLIRVGTGQLYSEGEGQTIDDGVARITGHSAFNLLVRPGQEVLTVVQGAASLAGAQLATVPDGTQVSIAGGRIVASRVVSPAELARITAWRHQYTFVPAAPVPQPYLPNRPRQYYPFPPPNQSWPSPDGDYRRPPRESSPPARQTRPPSNANPGGRYPNEPVPRESSPPARQTRPPSNANPGRRYPNEPVPRESYPPGRQTWPPSNTNPG